VSIIRKSNTHPIKLHVYICDLLSSIMQGRVSSFIGKMNISSMLRITNTELSKENKQLFQYIICPIHYCSNSDVDKLHNRLARAPNITLALVHEYYLYQHMQWPYETAVLLYWPKILWLLAIYHLFQPPPILYSRSSVGWQTPCGHYCNRNVVECWGGHLEGPA